MIPLLAMLALGLGDPDAAAALPRSLMEMEAPAVPAAADDDGGWWLGIRAGYIHSQDADNGSWVVGGQIRWHLLSFLAIEGSVEVRKDRYQDGDVKVFTIPVQVSGLVYLPVDWELKPYAVAGIGWYIMRTHFSGTVAADDETTHEFGFHLGVGAELKLSPKFSLNADFRYIFIDEPPHVGNSDFDGYEITIGANFKIGN